MKRRKKGLRDPDQEAILDSFLSADGARLLAEGLDWLKKDATDLLQEILDENADHGHNTGLLVSNRFASSDYQLLAKKYAILHDELSKMRESYRNQSLILAECEKKLEEALTDKAEVIQAKVDVLKLQSVYGLTWVPDDCVKECLQCGYIFSFFARQHHCRLCGRLFCANCTTNTCPIPTLGYNDPVRVCDHWSAFSPSLLASWLFFSSSHSCSFLFFHHFHFQLSGAPFSEEARTRSGHGGC